MKSRKFSFFKWFAPVLSALVFVSGLFLMNAIEVLFARNQRGGDVHVGNQLIFVVALFYIIIGYILVPVSQFLLNAGKNKFIFFASFVILAPIFIFMLADISGTESSASLSDFLRSVYLYSSLVMWYFVPLFLFLWFLFKKKR